MKVGFGLPAVLLCVLAAIIFGAWETGAGPGSWELARMALVFALVVALLRRNVDIGLTLLAGAVALGLLFAVPYHKLLRALMLGLIPGPQVPDSVLKYLRDATILVFLVSFINVLGQMLSVSGAVDRLIGALERLSGDVRIVAAVIPSTLGLLPMPGGAMMTAPFVEDLGNRLGLDATRKTGVNYWFRHVWEYWWPMFPSVLLMTQSKNFLPVPFSLPDLAVPGLVLSGASIIAGWFFLLHGRKRGVVLEPQQAAVPRPGHAQDALTVVRTFWPMAVIVIVVSLVPRWVGGAYKDLVAPVTMVAINLILWAIYALSSRQVWDILRKAFALRMVAMLYTIYILRAAFDVSGAANRLPETLAGYHLPVWLVCFMVPWIVGMLTGYTIAGVSTTFPLLGTLLGTHAAIIVAYMGAFIGVLMSPVHLCLILTKQYFHSSFGAVYRLLWPCFAVILLAVAIVGIVMWPAPVKAPAATPPASEAEVSGDALHCPQTQLRELGHAQADLLAFANHFA